MKNYSFTVNGPKPYMTEDWIQAELSDENKLVLWGYDANLMPSRDFLERPRTKWNQNIIKKALEVTKDYKGEVYLDSLKIRDKQVVDTP